MNDLSFKNILNSIKEASPAHLALVSFFLFPVAFKYWIDSILSLFSEIGLCVKIILTVLIVIIYLGCLIWIASENARKNRQKLIRDIILARLIANDWKSMSFESAKKVLPTDCTDEKIIAVIEAFPRTLRHARVKDKDENGNQKTDKNGKPIFNPGIGRLIIFD